MNQGKIWLVVNPTVGLPAFLRAARRSGVALDLRTRLLYARGQAAINGEAIAQYGDVARAVQRLADGRMLPPAEFAASPGSTASPGAGLVPLLYGWYRYGWLRIAT